MKKIMTVLTTTLFLGLSLAVSGCATTGMNGGMDNSMGGAATEMKEPAMNDTGNAMAAPAGQMMQEQKMTSPAMEEAPAPMMDEGVQPMTK
jgi:Flp pilus assembly protein TadD